MDCAVFPAAKALYAISRIRVRRRTILCIAVCLQGTESRFRLWLTLHLCWPPQEKKSSLEAAYGMIVSGQRYTHHCFPSWMKQSAMTGIRFCAWSDLFLAARGHKRYIRMIFLTVSIWTNTTSYRRSGQQTCCRLLKEAYSFRSRAALRTVSPKQRIICLRPAALAQSPPRQYWIFQGTNPSIPLWMQWAVQRRHSRR